jgi:hypothetical protein
MAQRDHLMLAVGIVAFNGSILVVAGVRVGDSTAVVIGASVLLMAGGSLAALGGTAEG